MPDDVTVTFASKDDLRAALEVLQDVINRLPTGSLFEAERLNGLSSVYADQILHGTSFVSPSEADGTLRYRESHGLTPIRGITE
jgi:hypothetical protein